MWLKAWHIISMVTWFAGLFYLPRLYVYHAMSDDKVSDERFKVMESKLYYGITTPSAIITMVLGVWMLYDYAWAIYGTMIWLHVKLTLVGLLCLYHLYCGKLLKDFAEGRNRHGHVWYRWFNELPVIVLIAVILLASIKPF